MKAIETWNLSHNQLHESFQKDSELLKFKVRGNTWEPITRWLKLDSRIFRDTTNKARITLCDIESLSEIYKYRSVRWRAKKTYTYAYKFYKSFNQKYFEKVTNYKRFSF